MSRSRKKAKAAAPANSPRGRNLLIAVLLVFLATHLWLLLAFEARLPDCYVYGRLAREGMDGGKVAYRDFEPYYPPVAWWVIAFPRLIDTKSYVAEAAPRATVDQYWNWYFASFHAEIFVADVICLLLMYAIGRRISPLATWGLPAAYTLLTIAQPHLLFDRLDIGLLMFLLLWVYCWSRSLETSPMADRWASASYFFLGLGIAFKVVPLICVPFVLLSELWASPSVWRPAALASSLAIGGLGPFLIHMPSAGWGVFSLFKFHAERDTHLESIWASMMLVARGFGTPSEVDYSHGGYNLTGPWQQTIKTVASATLFGMTAFFGLWALLRGRRFDRRLALNCACLVLFNSMVLSIVFSPQYLNWALPLALLLAIDVFPRSRAPWWIFAVLLCAVVGISTWIFPDDYREQLAKLKVLPAALSVIRSACLVGLAVVLNVAFFGHYGLAPWGGAPSSDGDS